MPAEDCTVRELDCPGGLLVVLCPPGASLLDHPRVQAEKFTSIAPGSLSMGYEDDWSRGYYVYASPRGGGFYLEGSLDAFDDPSCGAQAVPMVLEYLASRGLVDRGGAAMLEAILYRRVFRAP